jgi:hypothetical protein
MGVQPLHWVVTGRSAKQEGRLIGNEGPDRCVVIALTKEDACSQGAAMLGVPVQFVTAERITSGAPVYDPRSD